MMIWSNRVRWTRSTSSRWCGLMRRRSSSTACPNPILSTVWGKLVYTIDRPTMTPAQIDYFDEDLKLVRHLYFDRIEQIGERTIPMRMRVEPVDKPGESTELIYEEIAFDIGLTPEYFSLRNLKKALAMLIKLAFLNLGRNRRRTPAYPEFASNLSSYAHFVAGDFLRHVCRYAVVGHR